MSSSDIKYDGRTEIALPHTGVSIITYGIVQFLKGKDTLRAVLAAIGFLGVAIFFLTFFATPRVGSIAFIVLGGFLLYVAVISGPLFNVYIRDVRAIMERVSAEMKFKASPNPYSALELDTKRLTEYYIINQSQARSSF